MTPIIFPGIVAWSLFAFIPEPRQSADDLYQFWYGGIRKAFYKGT
ncbi:MAG: hypothetical protein WBL42_06690 [Methanoregula sp.]